MSRKLSETLLLSLGANAFGQMVTIATQVVQLPLFPKQYGIELTGEWLLLSAIPARVLRIGGRRHEIAWPLDLPFLQARILCHS